MNHSLEKLKSKSSSVPKKPSDGEGNLGLGVGLRESAVNLIGDDDVESGNAFSEKAKGKRESSGAGQAVSKGQGNKVSFEGYSAEQIVHEIEVLLKERIRSIEEKLDDSVLKKSPDVYNSMVIYLRSLRVKLNSLAGLVGKSVEFLRDLYNDIRGN